MDKIDTYLKRRLKEIEIRLSKLEESQSTFSIKRAKDCEFARRHGYKGFVLFGYSVLIRAFGKELKSVNICKLIKSFWK